MNIYLAAFDKQSINPINVSKSNISYLLCSFVIERHCDLIFNIRLDNSVQYLLKLLVSAVISRGFNTIH